MRLLIGNFTPAIGEVGRDAMLLGKNVTWSNEVGMVWSIKALETMRTGQIYIVFVCESGGTQMGSLCMVLPGCSLTDYFVPSRLVKRRVVKSRSGMIRDAAFFISGISGGGVVIIVVQRIPIIARVQSQARSR